MARQWITVGQFSVDPKLLESRSAARCRLEECRALCCGHGVRLDLADATRIVDEAASIRPHLPPDQRAVDNWFDGEVGEDADFPSGWQVGTQVVPDASRPDGTKCVFLRDDNRCALQVTSIVRGRHPWDLKPYYCALYPLILSGNTLELDDENAIYKLGGTCQREDNISIPLYRLLKDELILALGQAGYGQLLALAAARSED